MNAVWTLKYKETERGPWIDTILRAPTPDQVWALWSRLKKDVELSNYYAAMVLPLEKT